MRSEELNKLILGEIMHDEEDAALVEPPDYCRSLDAVAKVEAKLLKSIEPKKYATHLRVAVGIAQREAETRWPELLTANARHRAEACFTASRS